MFRGRGGGTEEAKRASGGTDAVSGHPIRKRRLWPRALIESEIQVAELCEGASASSTSLLLSSLPRAATSLGAISFFFSILIVRAHLFCGHFRGLHHNLLSNLTNLRRT